MLQSESSGIQLAEQILYKKVFLSSLRYIYK